MNMSIDGGQSAVANILGQMKSQQTTSSTPTSGTTGSTTTGSAVSSSTITASDFMTLLVTEMKNQDPTQPTDPTQYVQQLVQVNSLEQLIGINQGVGSLTTTTSKG